MNTETTRRNKAAHNARPLYRTWQKMRSRCNNPNAHNFKSYGAKGVRVCERWNSYEAFLADVGDRPATPTIYVGNERHYWTLDRIDPQGDYEPANVRWATIAEQRENKRSTR